jgi:hypothetical protein
MAGAEAGPVAAAAFLRDPKSPAGLAALNAVLDAALRDEAFLRDVAAGFPEEVIPLCPAAIYGVAPIGQTRPEPSHRHPGGRSG